MTVRSRREVREAIAAALETALAGQVQALYAYAAADFEGRSPVVRVLSGGSARQPRGLGEEMVIVVEFWVLFSQKRSGYTRQDAENTLDALEQALAAWAEGAQNGPLWTGVRYDGPSVVGNTAVVRGEAWLVEIVRLRVKVK